MLRHVLSQQYCNISLCKNTTYVSTCTLCPCAHAHTHMNSHTWLLPHYLTRQDKPFSEWKPTLIITKTWPFFKKQLLPTWVVLTAKQMKEKRKVFHNIKINSKFPCKINFSKKIRRESFWSRNWDTNFWKKTTRKLPENYKLFKQILQENYKKSTTSW